MFPRLIDELYPSLFSSPDFSLRTAIRRNLMHADSFLFIFRVYASINHGLSTIFSAFSVNLHTFQHLKLARCLFLTSHSVHWPSGGLTRTTGEIIVKTTVTFTTHRKTRIQYFGIFFFENEFLKEVKIYQKNKFKG